MGLFIETFIACWNRHDASAMAGFWTDRGDLWNTRGTLASGRAAIAALLAEEHKGPLAGSFATMALRRVRFLTADFAHVDAEMTLTGLRDPQGRPVELPLHVAFVARRLPEGWAYVSVRPYKFLTGL